MNIKKISTILCAFVIMFAVSERAEAGIDSTSSGFSNTFNTWGTCIFTTANDGTKKCIWIGEDGSFAQKKGHKGFMIDTSKKKDLPINFDITSDGLGELLITSNQILNCNLVDASSGKIIKQFIVDGSANISIGDLPKNKVYSILSTNKAGTTSSKKFILDDNNITYMSE